MPRPKTLADIGELEFIRNIRKMMPLEGGEIIRSVGDDCLVTRCHGESLLLSTIDTFVDGIHFTPEYFSFEQIGMRCMSASVSDIAAMSGLPLYSLLSLSMPPGTLHDDSAALFSGLAEKGRAYGCPIAGGETTSTTGPLTITITVIGRAEENRVIYRSGAQPFDSVYVTGNSGDAMAGLMAFEKGEKGYDSLMNKFISPEARIALARELSRRYKISAMIDLSDGIASDLGHICEESSCGAEIDAGLLPISQDMRELTSRYGIDPVHFALTAGEDYELLFTSPDPKIPERGSILDCRVTRIGTISRNRGELILNDEHGVKETIHTKGYEHFKS
ncbi:MAG: thiamine-phosphate kinase [Candidatus Latescibacterota bacterium]